jgi:hypothetical protein
LIHIFHADNFMIYYSDLLKKSLLLLFINLFSFIPKINKKLPPSKAGLLPMACEALIGGRGEIRTRGAIADTLALQASAFNRSATLPKY